MPVGFTPTGTLGTVVDTITYTYGDTNWGDLLTAYDGTAITYDGIGNPLSGGTWSYAWRNGRELASMTSGDTTWYYIYDADGMRTSRTTDGWACVMEAYDASNPAELKRFYYGVLLKNVDAFCDDCIEDLSYISN